MFIYPYSPVVFSILVIPKGKLSGIINICSQCPYSTPILSHFKRHLLIHSGKRPFTCQICNKSFRQKEHLKAHAITHESRCEICFIPISGKAELENHIASVHFM